MSGAAGRRRGSAGEDLARNLLERAGYVILARNYHSRYGEIDLVARKGDVVCFVEVKTRREGAMVSGAAAVTPAKQRRIIRTAQLYLQEHPCTLQPRFDVMALQTDRAGRLLCHDHWMGAFDCEAFPAW